MRETTLTVGMSNYNHAQFLRVSLDAILSQSRLPDEIIVIDDASTDGSLEILQEYERRSPLIRVIVNKRNRGVVANVQVSLAEAKGRYFYASAADDMILPEFFEKSLAILEQFPSAGLCSTLAPVMDKNGKFTGSINGENHPFCYKGSEYYVDPEQVMEGLVRYGSWVQGNTTILRRQALLDIGGYRTELGPYCDGFIYPLIALTHGACFVSEPLAAWRRMSDTYSAGVMKSPVKSSKIRDEALRCMTHEYGDLFPDKYIRRWQARWDSDYLRMFVCTQRDELNSGLRMLLPGDSTSNACFRGLVKWLMAPCFWLIWVVASMLRWFDIPWGLACRIRKFCSTNRRLDIQ